MNEFRQQRSPVAVPDFSNADSFRVKLMSWTRNPDIELSQKDMVNLPTLERDRG